MKAILSVLILGVCASIASATNFNAGAFCGGQQFVQVQQPVYAVQQFAQPPVIVRQPVFVNRRLGRFNRFGFNRTVVVNNGFGGFGNNVVVVRNRRFFRGGFFGGPFFGFGFGF